MYDFHGKGCFPAPHSPAISMPEFLQKLYAKINECVDAVNECITMVDASNNIVENWNTVKAECDMAMEQYANTMAGYASTMDGYTQELEDLEARVADLNTSISQLETLVEGYRTEVDQKAQEVLAEIESLSDFVVESGEANGWKWRKFKSGRVEATKIEEIDPDGKLSYDGEEYTLDHDITFPMSLVANTAMMWVQPQTSKMTSAVVFCTETYAKVALCANPLYSTVACRVYCRLEGMAVEET